MSDLIIDGTIDLTGIVRINFNHEYDTILKSKL